MPANFPPPIKDRDALLLARRTAELSQAELADLMGITANAVSHIETGITTLTRGRALHAALIFAWLKGDAQATPSAGVTLLARRAVGRPANIKSTTTVRIYRTAEGAFIRASEADALPIGTRLQRLSALGREPDETRDQWEWVTRCAGYMAFVPDGVAPPMRADPPPNTYRGANVPQEAVDELRRMLDNPAKQEYP